MSKNQHSDTSPAAPSLEVVRALACEDLSHDLTPDQAADAGSALLAFLLTRHDAAPYYNDESAQVEDLRRPAAHSLGGLLVRSVITPLEVGEIKGSYDSLLGHYKIAVMAGGLSVALSRGLDITSHSELVTKLREVRLLAGDYVEAISVSGYDGIMRDTEYRLRTPIEEDAMLLAGRVRVIGNDVTILNPIDVVK